ncbi:MFS transporter [Melioribacteraceae bacterium 4301-Me]|uniref:MFS transporter n=1 Tax=Pyranulibacter aquaticus TaxID=3163344 RepID=UPI00359B9D4C
MKKQKRTYRNPWTWVTTLYFAEGIPYVVVMSVSVIMYKRMGVSNTDIALYTSWLYLPWVIKPLWSPIVDILKTKRFWIILMQFIIGAALGAVALSIPAPNYFKYTLAFFWLMAFSSATHDIAADGFYMLGLQKHEQAFFIGIRSTFYRIAMITGQGLLIIFVGYLETSTGLPPVKTEIITIANSSKPNDIKLKQTQFQPQEGKLRVIASTDKIFLNISQNKNQNIDSIKSLIKNWNIQNGFYTNSEGDINSFSKKNGSVAAIYFHLSKEPPADKNIKVKFDYKSGDDRISIIEGNDFTFNSSNWNKPAYSLIYTNNTVEPNRAAIFYATAGNIRLSWVITFSVLGVLFMLFFIYHLFILPYPPNDKSVASANNGNIFSEFFKTFVLFFKKKNIAIFITFLLVYRLGESQLVKLASPFLLDYRSVGGLGLTTSQVGIVYGTVGMLALLAGGILGGFLAARDGLKHWLWWMVAAINVPNSVYIILSFTQTTSFFFINLCVAIEQFGYGFGFTAYMLYMIYISEGDHKTAHFAIATAFMALGMMLPGMVSGWIEDMIGYKYFFVWTLLATIPAFIITKFIPLDEDFGRKKEQTLSN